MGDSPEDAADRRKKIRLSAFYISRGGAAECRADFSITARQGITVRDGCGLCRRRIARPSGVTKFARIS
jgi:hypothetical protein